MADSSGGGCPTPFISPSLFPDDEGSTEGRFCREMIPGSGVECCLPCPLTEWVYPDHFATLTDVANWICVVSAVCCVFLLLSWAILPTEKTGRHYLSISLTSAVMFMNLGFIIPLAARPSQCYNDITPNDMHSSPVCGASGAMLLFGGFAGVMWTFLRAVSLHMQICWQLVVGKKFMMASHAAGWGVPVIMLIIALVFSGVSFRFGETCHINHENSLASFWVPLMVFSGLTVILQFTTFGYCIKVYLASLTDNSSSTEGSTLPTTRTGSTPSVRTMTPRQAYRRVRRVIALQWRGITIVLIIIADVIFFSVVFVFQDVTVHNIGQDNEFASSWLRCILDAEGDKDQCLDDAQALVVNEATITAVLILLAINGIWLLFFMGRWSMVQGWAEKASCLSARKKEFVSSSAITYEDAKHTQQQDDSAYEMLSKDRSASIVTPLDPVRSPFSPEPLEQQGPLPDSGRPTVDFFGNTARYHTPSHSFSSPRPPRSPPLEWDANSTFARPVTRPSPYGRDDINP